MANTTIFMLPITMDAFEKMKSLKETEQAYCLTDSEFLLSLINDPSEDLLTDNYTIKNSMGKFKEYQLSQSFCGFKKENETVQISSPNHQIDIVNTSKAYLQSPKIECKDCHQNFKLESELLNHYEQYHAQPNQFKCSCGDNFQCLQLFLQHKFICSHLKTNMKIEKLTTDRKRHGLEDDNQNGKRIKFSELNCESCDRKFRTSSALYLHECRKTKSDDSHKSNDNSQPEIIVSKENLKPIELVVPNKSIKFTCRCAAEFNDYYEYSSHCNKCGKIDILESSTSTSRYRSSPLEILPNENGKFDCKDCTKSFNTRLSLRQHREGMHRMNPKYVCKICRKGYRWCTSFNYHKRKCELKK